MSHTKPFALALLGFIGIETLTLSDIEIVTKIICELSVAVITCWYIHKKSKQIKK